MIDRHYNLSCYALQFPFRAYYSQYASIIQLIDVNNEIYKFRLPDYQHYEKIQANCTVKEYFRVQSTVFILYQTKQFVIMKNGEQSIYIQNIESVGILVTKEKVLFFLNKTKEYASNSLTINATILKFQEVGDKYLIQQKSWILQKNCNQPQYQKQSKHLSLDFFEVQLNFGQFCLIKNNKGSYELIKLLNLHHQGIDKEQRIIYQLLNCWLPPSLKVIGCFKNTLTFVSQNLQQKQQALRSLYLLDAQQQQVVALKQLNINTKLQYIIFQRFLIALDHHQFVLFQTMKGTLLTKFNILSMLESFEAGSSMILGQQHQKQSRYSLLFDKLCLNLTQFYLIDKQKLSIYNISISKFLNFAFLQPLKNTIGELEGGDNQFVHQNVMKTLNFRLKKLQTLQQYVDEGMKVLSFGNVIRFLQNQQNIFVLNDGLYLFHKALQANFQRFAKQKQIAIQLQKQLIKICTKLITQSKYQDHIVKGLTISNSLYFNLRNKYKSITGEQNRQLYNSLLQTKRVVRLLKQEKNKQMFQLSCQLAVSVKGYDYLQQIQKKKK